MIGLGRLHFLDNVVDSVLRSHVVDNVGSAVRSLLNVGLARYLVPVIFQICIVKSLSEGPRAMVEYSRPPKDSGSERNKTESTPDIIWGGKFLKDFGLMY